MLNIKIWKSNDLFDVVYTCQWQNAISGKKKDAGIFTASSAEEIFKALRPIIAKQVSTTIQSITSERRWVFTNYWHPDTMRMCQLKDQYIEKLNQIDRILSAIQSQPLESITTTINDLCDGLLKNIIPGPGKSKHDSILSKVNKIKEFFSDSIRSINPSNFENLVIN